MNQKYIDDNGVTVYGYKPEAVVKAEKKREGKAEKLLKHLSPEEINYVREHPHILDALGKQASNPLYKRASKEMARTKAEQLVKASEKYPEPLNPESWTGEQLADHAFQEVFDLTSYITGMKIKFEGQGSEIIKLHGKADSLKHMLDHYKKAHQATIRQAQKWKKDFVQCEDAYETLHAQFEQYKTDWMVQSYDADMFKQQRDELQKNFYTLENNYEESLANLEMMAKQKTDLLNRNIALAKEGMRLEKENKQLYEDNSSLESKVKDLQVEAKLWKDKFHLVKSTDDTHICKNNAEPIFDMGEMIKVVCNKCGKTVWDRNEE